MPSTSPGLADTTATAPATTFAEILPGAPAQSLQATTTWIYRFKRYIAYISGSQLNVLSGPSTLVQVVSFKHELVAVAADPKSGKLIVAGRQHAWILEPVAEGWTKIWWEKALLLRQNDNEEETLSVCWSNEGEALLAGSKFLTLFSTLPTSRSSSPRTSAIEGEAVEERVALWSRPVARPVQQVTFSPSSTLIASRSRVDRLVKIWRRLSFEEGLFDHTYLPHPAAVTHIEWRPLEEHSDIRRGSAISRRHDEEQEVLYTIATDGVLRIWRTGGIHDLDMLILHTSIDLVAAIPDSPSLSANGKAADIKPARYAVMLPADQFSAALNAAIGLSQDNKISHAKEHMKELVSQELDVVIVLDGQGRMSAWGLQSIGHKRRPDSPTEAHPLHLAHAEGLPLRFPASTPAIPTAWFQDDKFHILMHSLPNSGDISWWQGLVEGFFSTSASGENRLSLSSSWHSLDLAAWSDVDKVNGENEGVTLSETGQIETTLHNRTSTYETGVTNGTLLAVNADVAAVVDSSDKNLCIIDLRNGYIEHRQSFTTILRAAQCFSSIARRSFLAVAFDTEVQVLSQGKYVQDEASTRLWHTVQRISIAHLGLKITGLAWRRDGSLALQSGAVLLVHEPVLRVDQLSADLSEAAGIPEDASSIPLQSLAVHCSQSLPIWHPTALERFVLHNHVRSAEAVVRTLVTKLKFWTSGDELDILLDQDLETIFAHTDSQESRLDAGTVTAFKEQLQEKQLPRLSRHEQQRLGHVVDTLLYIRDHVKGLDTNALYYLFAWKLQLTMHYNGTGSDDGATPVDDAVAGDGVFVPEMSWREITIAYHSASQQPLLDILILHYDNKLTWDIARRLGIMSWLTDREALAQVFEQMAQTAYRSASPPDPVNAAIYYLALHKKQTLVALWRIATWHREQRSTTNFLKKDFAQAEAKTAAKKNAYALMGKRRFHYAAAFFLLADTPADACNVLAGQCDDLQFAVAVARLFCGDGSSVLRHLLAERVLPDAQKAGNRYLQSWCHSEFLEPDKAASCLVKPLSGIEKFWSQDDPALLLLYQQLRKTPSEHEFAAVLRSAKVLDRMGLPFMAVDMLNDWQFPSQVPGSKPGANRLTNGFHDSLPDRTASVPESPMAELIEPPSLLDAFTRPEPARSTSKDDQSARETKAAELLAKIKARKNASEPKTEEKTEATEKRQPTQFKEPDANSLLDSFGF
ncbi:Putative RAVE complex protein Rav1 [Septoria linicola]|uniref:RAVE complex protein Rav1 n=1 Tax=Septoria linicola TaxID=215465 RepID=A0A9Q9EGP2_9PEZI|nr:putative RAVE complex protein Rav1 [Septoria linicola]USW49037.1 Putative RAVE complex protein Rav1 [Septoria linicola]